MTLLILGLAVFFAVHLAIAPQGWRTALAARLGGGGRKGAVAFGSFLGFALILHGYGEAPYVDLYAPYPWARDLGHAVMPIAFILAAGSQLPSNFARYVGHPMSIGVVIWAAVHLLANGHLAAVLLFASFGLYALLNIFGAGPLGRPAMATAPLKPRLYDLGAILAGLIGYGAAIWAHGALGVDVTG